MWSLGAGSGLEAVELAIRTAMMRLGGRLLEGLLGLHAGHRLLRGHRDDWLAARLEELDTGNISALLAAGRNLPFIGCLARERDRQLGYFQVNAHRMRYRHFRDLGMFIGSAVVEAGCKAVIVPAAETVRHALEHPWRHRHRHPALPRS